MKSFSPAGIAGDYEMLLQAAEAAVADNPQALFTDFQWFLFEAKDAVFYTAFSTKHYDKQALGELVARMVALAPHLSHGFVGARPGHPFAQHLLDAITSVEEVDEFDGYPDKWIGKSEDIYARDDLPLFRLQAAVRRGGPDSEGRASIIQLRASHAVLEGADSALLTRSVSAARDTTGNPGTKVSWRTRILGTLKAQSLAWTYVGMANLFAPPERPWDFKTLAIERHRLRKLANRIGVRQRSLYFALVTYALNDPQDGAKPKKVIGAAYTLLGDNSRTELEDKFLRVRALQAKFRVREDFIDYVRDIDDTVAELEAKDISKFMATMGMMMKTLRGLNRMWKGLPGRRFWRFSMGVDIALTLVPPHRTYGPITEGLVEPIYCGAWHPAQNICTYCPGRKYVTMNFAMDQRLIDKVGKIMPLLERLEAQDIEPGNRRPRDESDDA